MDDSIVTNIQTQLRLTQLGLVTCLIVSGWSLSETYSLKKTAEKRILQLEKVEIVNRDDRVLISLSADDEGGRGGVCHFYNSSAVPVTRLDAGLISFSNSEAKVASFGVTDAGGYLALNDKQGKSALGLWPDFWGAGIIRFYKGNQIKMELPESPSLDGPPKPTFHER